MQRKSINESDLFDWENDMSGLDDSIGEPPMQNEIEVEVETIESVQKELVKKTKQLAELSSAYKIAQEYIEKLHEHYHTKKEMFGATEDDNRELNEKLLVVKRDN
jgi:uncharacterized membrane-anchored protein YhcB (DUF1043 family)